MDPVRLGENREDSAYLLYTVSDVQISSSIDKLFRNHGPSVPSVTSGRLCIMNGERSMICSDTR